MKKITIFSIIIILIGFTVYQRENIQNFFKNNDKIELLSLNMIIKGFLDDMILHHDISITESNKVLAEKKLSPEVLKLAANIFDTHTFETNKMINLYADVVGKSYGVKILLEQESDKVKEYTDKDFLKMMIKHHKKSINTAEDILKRIDKSEKGQGYTDGTITITNTHPNIEAVKDLAKQIIANQTKEIEIMQSLK